MQCCRGHACIEIGCALLFSTSVQGMPAPSDISSVEALLEEYQGSLTAAAGGHAAGGAVRALDGITDPLASLDASIKGTLSPGNVSLLKPWGQPIPEVQLKPQSLRNACLTQHASACLTPCIDW